MAGLINAALVTELLARQNHAIDEGDAVAWAATYTPDGSFFSPTYGEIVAGTEALIRFAERAYADLTSDGIQQRHWVNNVVVDNEADLARSYLMIVRIDASGAPSVARHVIATDELVFHDGELKIRARRIQRDG